MLHYGNCIAVSFHGSGDVGFAAVKPHIIMCHLHWIANARPQYQYRVGAHILGRQLDGAGVAVGRVDVGYEWCP